MTRYEKIKNMSLEEMTLFFKDLDVEDILVKIKYCERHCPLKDKCEIGMIDSNNCYDIDFKESTKIWLSQEAEDNIDVL